MTREGLIQGAKQPVIVLPVGVVIGLLGFRLLAPVDALDDFKGDVNEMKITAAESNIELSNITNQIATLNTNMDKVLALYITNEADIKVLKNQAEHAKEGIQRNENDISRLQNTINRWTNPYQPEQPD